MSVRNILDGTIKVGGGGGTEIGPESDVVCRTLTTSALTADDIEAVGLKTDEYVKCEDGYMKAKRLEATESAILPVIRCDDHITAPKVITENILTPKLTLNNKSILKVQDLNTSITFKGVGLDGTTAKTFSQDVRRFLHDITPDLHVLVINTKITDVIPFKQMIVPLDLECGSGTSAFGTTVVKTSSGYINAIVELSSSDSKLQAKFTFETGTEYTSMQIKVNMIFF